MNDSAGAARMRRLRASTVALTIGAVTIGGLGTVASAAVTQPPGSIGVQLLDVPADRADDPRARAAILDHAAPGGRTTRTMGVVSTVDEAVTVDVYAGNAKIEGGQFVPAELERGLADWVSLDREQLTLPPGGTAEVQVAIDIPTNAPTGEYYGIVWVEPPAGEGQISVSNRVGVRVYLTVGLGDEPTVDFRVGAITAQRAVDGTPFVTAQIRNTGGRALDISGQLTLSDGPAGLAAGPFPLDAALALAPDETREVMISLDPELPDGPWTARLEAVSGLLVREVEARITFPSDAGTAADPAESEIIGGTDADGNDISEELRQQRRTLLPIAALLILLAIAGLFLLLWWQRRDHDEDDENQESTVPAGVGRDDS